MGLRIVGDHPEGGIRFDLERTAETAPWVYEGSAFTSDVDHKLRASVDACGVVTVDDEDALPKEVVQRAKLLLRTAWKHADGAPLPRRLHRWRPS
jgi:hypothetical protein